MYWLKQLEADDVESIATAIDTTAHIEYAKRGKYAYNNMLSLSHSCERLPKTQYAVQDVLTIVEKITRIFGK